MLFTLFQENYYCFITHISGKSIGALGTIRYLRCKMSAMYIHMLSFVLTSRDKIYITLS